MRLWELALLLGYLGSVMALSILAAAAASAWYNRKKRQ